MRLAQALGPAIEFDENADEDSLAVELSDFFSLDELAELDVCRRQFDALLADWLGVRVHGGWRGLSATQQADFIVHLLDRLELCAVRHRRTSLGALLHLLVGRGDASDVASQLASGASVAHRIVALGGFQACVLALRLAAKDLCMRTAAGQVALAPGAIHADADVRLALNVLYFVLMHVRASPSFVAELQYPAFESRPLLALILGMVSDFNDALGRLLPIKKALLLLWKLLLATLGGSAERARLQREKEAAMGMPLQHAHVAPLDERAAFESSIAPRFQWLCGAWPDGLPRAHREARALFDAATAPTILSTELAEIRFAGPDAATAELVPAARDYVPRALQPAPSPMEAAYQLLLPNFSRYVIILLKILLAAAPAAKGFSGTMCLTAELSAVTGDDPIAALDLARHKELIVKAVSAVLVLLLAHAQLSHAYQFEYLSLLLTDANGILLVLKLLNRDTAALIFAEPEPANMLLYPPPPRPAMDEGAARVSWRSTFSLACQLRLLSLLTATQTVRIRQLIRYKSPAILRRLLRINHTAIRRLVLELMRRQVRLLGRKWRAANMRLVSLMYCELGPEPTEAWLYADRSAEDASENDYALRRSTDDFNRRNYLEHRDWPVAAGPVALRERTLSDVEPPIMAEWARNYQQWLETELAGVPDDDAPLGVRLAGGAGATGGFVDEVDL